MTIEIAHPIRRTTQIAATCPVCNQKMKINMDHRIFNEATLFPITHVVLHGNPLHALIVYLDANFRVRGEEGCSSIEVARNSDAFSQLVKIWSNPF
jgi:hypothetical protein